MNTPSPGPCPPSSSSPSSMEMESLVNKSFLVVDEIQETYLPLFEKTIFVTNDLSKKNDKCDVAKLEFIIHKRIEYVANNLDYILSLLGNEHSTNDLTFRIDQLGLEQKRIVAVFKSLQHKKLERERCEKEQEEFLTRRFTNSNESSTNNNNNNPESCALNLGNIASDVPRQGQPLNRLRNQKQPLVKRVRTRYLNFSTDVFGMTKMFLKHSCVDLIILLASALVIFMLIFCYIVWRNASLM